MSNAQLTAVTTVAAERQLQRFDRWLKRVAEAIALVPQWNSVREHIVFLPPVLFNDRLEHARASILAEDAGIVGIKYFSSWENRCHVWKCVQNEDGLRGSMLSLLRQANLVQLLMARATDNPECYSDLSERTVILHAAVRNIAVVLKYGCGTNHLATREWMQQFEKYAAALTREYRCLYDQPAIKRRKH